MERTSSGCDGGVVVGNGDEEVVLGVRNVFGVRVGFGVKDVLVDRLFGWN